MRSPRDIAVALAALSLSLSCAEIDTSPDEWKYDGPINSCGGGCAEGACDDALGVCAVDPPVGDSLIARVVPDSATGVPPQIFEVGAGSASVTLYVASPVPAVATVVAGEAEPLEGRVIFSDRGNRLPGRPARVAVFQTDGDPDLDIDLVPSTYDIIVVPEGSQADGYPQRYLDGVTLDVDGVLRDTDGSALTAISAPAAAAKVVGRITQGDSPANGLEVVAFDPETSRTISTVDQTECVEIDEDSDGSVETVCGYFSLGLAKHAVDVASEFSLRISRPSESSHPVFVAEGLTTPAAGGVLDLAGDARLAFAPVGVPIRVRAVVYKPVAGSDGEIDYVPAPSCYVALSASDVGGGSVERWVLTDESGEIEDAPGNLGVNLYPGDYGVTVIPAHATAGAATDYAAFTAPETWTVAAGSVDDPFEIRLQTRPILSGGVLAGGLYVPTSAVSAEPAHGAPEIARSNSAISGSSGRFRLWLDEGPYVVTAEAPEESAFAWSLAEVAVESSPGEVDLALSLPFVQRGAVEPRPDQAISADTIGAVVEWYREIGGRAFEVGRTFVDGGGSFVALLPP